ncbi:hypothetical protein HDF22_000806 [Mucilaginibacter lappiensis]|uniref:Uncharacterized protein n=1 Tax=Mucilaginibacter lappiensis TaxID=354630 RepID=A0A841JF51_9SPHI|nr:hypothetical protein [Mucilaginibacter lappiensis]
MKNPDYPEKINYHGSIIYYRHSSFYIHDIYITQARKKIISASNTIKEEFSGSRTVLL